MVLNLKALTSVTVVLTTMSSGSNVITATMAWQCGVKALQSKCSIQVEALSDCSTF